MKRLLSCFVIVVLWTCAIFLPSFAIPVSAAKRIVTFWVIWGDSPEFVEYQAFKRLVNEFNQESRTVEVKLVPGPGDYSYFDKLITATAAGNPPDLFVDGIDVHQELLSVLVPVDSTSLAGHLDLKNYVPFVQENAVYNGHWYTIPWSLGTQFLLYNPKVFDELGLPSASAPETWTELDKIGMRIAGVNKSGRPDLFALVVQFDAWGFEPWIWQAGGRLYDSAKPQVTINTPQVVKALRFLAEGVNAKGYIAPPGNDTGRLIKTGNLAMWEALPQHYSIWRQITGEYPQVALLPKDVESGTTVGGWHLYMANTPNRDATVEFLTWLTDPDRHARYLIDSGTVTPRFDLAQKSATFKEYLAQHVEARVALQQVMFGRMLDPAIRRTPIGPQVEQLLQDAFMSAIRNKEAPEGALQKADEAANARLKQWLERKGK